MKYSAKLVRVLLIGTMAVTGALAGSAPAWADHDQGQGKSQDNRGGGQPNDNLSVYLDRTVHPTAQEGPCVAGQVWAGDGIPPTTFQRKRNLPAGIELAIKGHYRQGFDIRSTYVDGDGLVHIEVPTGPQVADPARGVSTGVANRAAWNFTFSYDAALNPSNPSLDQYDGQLWIDLDPSEKTKYLKLRLARLGPTTSPQCPPGVKDLSGFGWKSGNTIVIPDDEGDPASRVTQNSQNLAFYTAFIDNDPNQPGIQPYTFGPGEFDVVMILGRKGSSHDDDDDDGNRRWTILHVVFDVVSAPTQTP